MGKEIPVQIARPVSTQGTPETYLRQKDFDALITRFGYDAYVDKIMPCCCKEQGTNAPKTTCKNCHGTGFFLAERIQTKVWLAQMNFPTEYKDWSIENIGTAHISTLSFINISFMDRVVLFQERNTYAELIYSVLEGDKYIAYCAYPPVEINLCKVFQNTEEKLKDIDPSHITIQEDGKIIFDTEATGIIQTYINERAAKGGANFSNNVGISIRYTYMPSYHIIDITRNLITSKTDTPTDGISAKGTRVQFPYAAVGRMSHLVLGRSVTSVMPDYNDNAKPADKTTSAVATNILNGHDVSKEFCETEKQQ